MAELRRARLLTYIKRNPEYGNVNAFATGIGKSPSQIADMLAGRKAFGEKVAREIERLTGMPTGSLDRFEEQEGPDAEPEHVGEAAAAIAKLTPKRPSPAEAIELLRDAMSSLTDVERLAAASILRDYLIAPEPSDRMYAALCELLLGSPRTNPKKGARSSG